MQTQNPNTIGLIEDNQLMRMCIEEFAASDPELQLLFSCNSMEEWQAHFASDTRTPMLLLVDLGLPGISGVQVIDRLLEKYPDTNLMIISGESAGETVWEAIAIGAIGYLMKPFSPKEIRQQIQLLKEGQLTLLPRVADKLHHGLHSIPGSSFKELYAVLDTKEQKLLGALLKGMTSKQVSKQLHLSAEKISEMVRKIYDKAGYDQKSMLISEVLLARQDLMADKLKTGNR